MVVGGVGNCWILFCSLIQRSENIILVPLLDLQVRLVRGFVSQLNLEELEDVEVRRKLREKKGLRGEEEEFGDPAHEIQPPLLSLLILSSFFYQVS